MDISTADDITRKALERNLGPEESLSLPSGLVFMVRRPTPMWWAINRGILPSRLVTVAQGNESRPNLTPEELAEWARFCVLTVIEAVVTQPKIRQNPGPGEAHPGLISDEDFKAIMAFAGGEIAADGQGLDTFRREPGLSDSGSSGEPVELPAE